MCILCRLWDKRIYLDENSEFSFHLLVIEQIYYNPKIPIGPESFHSNFNKQLYSTYLNFHQVIELLLKIQYENIIKINSISNYTILMLDETK